jgi:hypothetical protein
MKRIVLAGSLLAFLLTGCASTVFESRADLAGSFHRHGEVSPTDKTPHLFIESAPDDFALSNVDGSIRFDKSKYEYLGKIYVRRNFDNWRWGFVSYNEPWRRYVCPPTMTLTYGTGFLFAVTGLPFFCAYETSNAAKRLEERKRHLALAAIERGMWIGASHIIYATYTGVEYPQGAGRVKQVDNGGAVTAIASESQFPYQGMVAHAFRRK